MKWCVQFPVEDILIKRPCLRKACVGNKAASTLLSFLLYQVSINQEFKKHMEENLRPLTTYEGPKGQEEDFTLYKTQSEIVAQMDNEISDRTLRDTAIPLLVALGYINVDESEKTNRYTLYPAKIQAGINNPPTKQGIFPILQHLIERGNISDKYRKYFRRLSEMLLANDGNSADDKNNNRRASRANRKPYSSTDKNRKSFKDTKKIVTVAAIDTDKNQNEMAITPTLPIGSPQASLRDSQNKLSQHAINAPDMDASETITIIIQMVEHLRGQSFQELERHQQARAAAVIMKLRPALSLKDIEKAWLHGSDEYWKKNHDPLGMKITDLAHHNSHGKRRIIAALEHKRHQELIRKQVSRPTLPPRLEVSGQHITSTSMSQQANPKSIMTEQEAIQLAAQVKQDGQKHEYQLQARSSWAQDRWLVEVQIDQHIFTIHSQAEWSKKLAEIHEILQLKKKLNYIGKDTI
ncbi:hypothetical protein KDW_38200 [Dictyobacter vulcani]|uniref:Uncharacterized protein n=1 Tax=Dictyobacter vulcani TaxID=2607529 RepID=A0A5J4KIX9_9CHLR|nr:hypothetical protein [Dictyobacter vulcani]GER89658.1 hypothetical protein KDW_38200 [Dictyobacter vulcani]